MSLLSWGRYPVPVKQDAQRVHWRDEIRRIMSAQKRMLPRGLGRSYGDSCLLSQGTLIEMTSLNRVIAFDAERGVIRVEAGMSLADVLAIIVPKGWFLPVSPGTKFVTIGGAIANDIHGKNHHEAGTFGCHVRSFELVRSDGTAQICSTTEHVELFFATIGGLGLTGCISWAEIQLIPISSSVMEGVYTAFEGVGKFVSLSDQSTAPYTVAWIDASSDAVKGIFIEGRHAEKSELAYAPKQLFTIPFLAPGWLLSSFSVGIFNRLYGFLQRMMPSYRHAVSIDSFFYPLDSIGNWNRLYGKRGFIQYQFVVPESASSAIHEVLFRLRQAGHLSFLTVLKKFGTRSSPGLLSFPRPGLTLALDLPFKAELLPLLEELDRLVLAAGGRLYPAKDARMSAEMFQKGYPRWRELEQVRDKAITSDFWERVTKPLL